MQIKSALISAQCAFYTLSTNKIVHDLLQKESQKESQNLRQEH